MKDAPKSRLFICMISILSFCLGCASGSVKEKVGPTIQEAQAVPAVGPKARIAVAQFVNNTGGLNSQLQRMAVQMQAQMANMSQQMLEYQKKMIPYQNALMVWQARVASVGEKKAGPPPTPPEFSSSSSPYMTTVTDPVAGGVRDMMINALFNSGRFIVLERQEINKINWEQEFSRSGFVGEKTKIPIGNIEGAELLLIGSLTTLEAEESGGDVGALLSTLASSMGKNPLGKTEVGVSWKNAKAAMEIRLVDARTSRVVAAATVEGKATSVGASGHKPRSSYYSGQLPAHFSAYKNTPVEEAFREMIQAGVQYLVEKTPNQYYHQPPQ